MNENWRNLLITGLVGAVLGGGGGTVAGRWNVPEPLTVEKVREIALDVVNVQAPYVAEREVLWFRLKQLEDGQDTLETGVKTVDRKVTRIMGKLGIEDR